VSPAVRAALFDRNGHVLLSFQSVEGTVERAAGDGAPADPAQFLAKPEGVGFILDERRREMTSCSNSPRKMGRGMSVSMVDT
jgi:hypothetical protein